MTEQTPEPPPVGRPSNRARAKYTRGARIVLALTLFLVAAWIPINNYRNRLELGLFRHVAPAWASFSPANRDFTVLMPSLPTHTTQTHRVGESERSLDRWAAQTSKAFYDVLYCEYPAEPDGASLDSIALNLQAMEGRKLLSDHTYRADGSLCRDLAFSDISFPEIKTRLYLDGRRLYMLTFKTIDPAASAADSATFFNSFKILRTAN